MATWGKVVGTGLVVGGLATLGIGLGGSEVAQAVGASAGEGAAAGAAATAETTAAVTTEAAATTTTEAAANAADATAAAGETPLGTKIGNAIQTATDKVQGVAKSAADAVGLEEMSGKTAAGIAGGTAAVAGGVILASSGEKNPEDAARERAEEEIKAIRQKMRMMEQEHGVDLDGDGSIAGRTPPAPDRGGNER